MGCRGKQREKRPRLRQRLGTGRLRRLFVRGGQRRFLYRFFLSENHACVIVSSECLPDLSILVGSAAFLEPSSFARELSGHFLSSYRNQCSVLTSPSPELLLRHELSRALQQRKLGSRPGFASLWNVARLRQKRGRKEADAATLVARVRAALAKLDKRGVVSREGKPRRWAVATARNPG
jgi:hypothetical protein